MTIKKLTSAQIRQEFLDFFIARGHKFVPSASLVPGGDATLLFTNAGMVQFKDVFLGTDKRPYTRVVNSQKCMRVAGKHNDLEDVGNDDSHHTFFEMLGNWSFGDYYKKEAIGWAWQLLTEVWGLPKEKLFATCFRDDQNKIAADDEAAEYWHQQPGLESSHILFFGRKENFWEMAETGPCGPCSEIHYDRGIEYCDKKNVADHICGVNHDCQRFLELWNLVFIQYCRLNPDSLESLPATHVDTGMGFDRIVSVLQGVDSNYKTDLFKSTLAGLRNQTGDAEKEMYANFTPYRVIADHTRAATFLIADGVVPGNIGRNYVCRMIIRRAARFGMKLGLHDPFIARISEAIIDTYGSFYPELIKQEQVILDSLMHEELRFRQTIESGSAYLQGMLENLRVIEKKVLDGKKAFDLYTTYGLPFEIARDIAREQHMDIDEVGFHNAMDNHRITSGGGNAIGTMSSQDANLYSGIFNDLLEKGLLSESGVVYDPYIEKQIKGQILVLVTDGQSTNQTEKGDHVEVLLPKTNFYVQSGGQVSDIGSIRACDHSWEVRILDMRMPSSGMIVHLGEVVLGHPKVGDLAVAEVDIRRRYDIMRNHTATHLLHAALRKILGEHARQAGSLVAPDRLRFDFNHNKALTSEQLKQVERFVNEAIFANYTVTPTVTSRDQAVAGGAVALFGEKYGDIVRTIAIGDKEEKYSYELCGGIHLDRTGDVGVFIVVSESSVAAGIRRIEAVTGHGAYELINSRFKLLEQTAVTLKSNVNEVPQKVGILKEELSKTRTMITSLRSHIALSSLNEILAKDPHLINDVNVVATLIPDIHDNTLRLLADKFREKYPEKGVCVIITKGEKILVMATVTQDLIKKGLKAGDLVSHLSEIMGTKGGGASHLAIGNGKDESKIFDALFSVDKWLERKLK